MPKQRLRVCSYNVHSWVGRDDRCDPKRVAGVIRELDADIVALQEVRSLTEKRLTAPLADLCDERGYEIIEGPTLDFEKSSYGNALLSRLPVRDVSRLDLSVPGREPRGAVAVSLDGGHQSVCVVNTHLGLRVRERVHQVSKLLEWIRSGVFGSAPDVLSLVGDFNEWRFRAATLGRIDAAFAWAAAPRSFPSARPWFRLDRVWVLPRAVVRGQSASAHRSAAARVASDHLPVVVDFEI